jgi:microcystin-dependent protein
MTSYRDWTVELSNTTGTGAYALAGAPAGTSYFTFRQRYSNGEDEIVFWVVNANRTKWEKNRLGELTFGTPDMLSRNVIESTNGDAPVSWVGGDLPLRIYVVPDSEQAEGSIRGWLATARSALLRYGLWFKQDNPSSGLQSINIYDGTQDIRLGYVNPTRHTARWDSTPPGVLMPYAGASAPVGFLLCYGQAVSRTDCADLFDAIGTAYGSGDGFTTFNVPDLRGRVIAGKDNMGGSAASRLTGTTISSGAATLGNVGGAETEAAGVSVTVSGGISGVTAGSLSTSASGSGSTDTANGTGGVVGGGPATSSHSHGFSVTTAGATGGALPVSGSFSGSGGGATATVTNVQPTIIANYIIKT